MYTGNIDKIVSFAICRMINQEFPEYWKNICVSIFSFCLMSTSFLQVANSM